MVTPVSYMFDICRLSASHDYIAVGVGMYLRSLCFAKNPKTIAVNEQFEIAQVI